MSSYDELLKQVECLRAENSHLRQELNESSSHPESAATVDVFEGLDGDSDIDVIYDGEDGIHVFQQGGGGESRDQIVEGEGRGRGVKLLIPRPRSLTLMQYQYMASRPRSGSSVGMQRFMKE